ncbi:MAG: hypothetical protein HOV83_08725, partial [Catenulispora sp.]|nr:hypothetical protein [Catenulispora sp.]
SFVRGAAHLSTDPNRGPTLDVAAMAAAGALERYPHLLRAAEQAASTDSRAAFTNGLDRLLEGIAARA